VSYIIFFKSISWLTITIFVTNVFQGMKESLFFINRKCMHTIFNATLIKMRTSIKVKKRTRKFQYPWGMEGYNITNNTNNNLPKSCLLLRQGYKVEIVYININSKILKTCGKKFTFLLELLVICLYFCMGHMQKIWNI